ncbi:MAG: hypothetical protein U0271_00210 [Polyangiaceae bacterium]
MKTGFVVLLCVGLAACGDSNPVPGSGSAPKASASASTKGASSSKTKPSASSPVTATTPVETASSSAAAVSASAPVESAPAAGADIAPSPVKFVITEKGKSITIEVKADGSIVSSDEGDKDALKIVKNEIRDPKGEWILRINADDSIELNAGGRVEKLGTLKGSVIEGPKVKIELKEDGTISVTADGKTETVKDVKIEGLTAENTRTAAILAAFIVLSMRMEASHGEPASSGAPAASAAPVAK